MSVPVPTYNYQGRVEQIEMGGNAEFSVLYEEGDLNYAEPGTFEVKVFKWDCLVNKYVTYTLNVDIVTDIAAVSILSRVGLYKVKHESVLLDTNLDGEAIRAGVMRFLELSEGDDDAK